MASLHQGRQFATCCCVSVCSSLYCSDSRAIHSNHSAQDGSFCESRLSVIQLSSLRNIDADNPPLCIVPDLAHDVGFFGQTAQTTGSSAARFEFCADVAREEKSESDIFFCTGMIRVM